MYHGMTIDKEIPHKPFSAIHSTPTLTCLQIPTTHGVVLTSSFTVLISSLPQAWDGRSYSNSQSCTSLSLVDLYSDLTCVCLMDLHVLTWTSPQALPRKRCIDAGHQLSSMKYYPHLHALSQTYWYLCEATHCPTRNLLGREGYLCYTVPMILVFYFFR
jgi:hypothetical protein